MNPTVSGLVACNKLMVCCAAPRSPESYSSSLRPADPTAQDCCDPSVSLCSTCLETRPPLYHPAPASNQRTWQSRAYLAYIDGLGSHSMCDWQRELATTTSLVEQEVHLPLNNIPPWLERLSVSEGRPGVESFCALRDFMLQEALNVVKSA